MENENEPIIEEKELKAKVWNVMQFADAYFGKYSGYGGYNYFSPDGLNQSQKDLNINPIKPTASGIENALNNVKGSEDILQAYTEWAEFNDMMFSRIIKYYSSILAFDLKMDCMNASGANYKSKEYKADLAIAYKWLDRFDVKEQFGNMVKEMLRHETVFTSLRDESSLGYRLQKLPSKYCMITSDWQKGLYFDFNMIHFTEANTSLDLYHSAFKKYYYNVYMKNDNQDYDPSNPITDRKGTYTTWTQTSPNDGFWCFKFNTNNNANIPFLTPLLQDVILNSTVRALQADKNALSSFMTILGEMPLLDNQKSGATADGFAIDPTTMGALYNIIRSTLSKNVKLSATPSKENESYQYQDYNKEMYSDQIKNMTGIGASASRTLFANDKLSMPELQACQMNDYNLMKPLYTQFNNFLDFYVNRKTRVYKFKFTFDGSNFPFEREARFARTMTLADKGIVLPQEIQSASGISPQAFDRMLDYAKYSGFGDKLTQLLSIHTASGGDAKRPTKSTNISSNSRDYDNSNGG